MTKITSSPEKVLQTQHVCLLSHPKAPFVDLAWPEWLHWRQAVR